MPRTKEELMAKLLDAKTLDGMNTRILQVIAETLIDIRDKMPEREEIALVDNRIKEK